MLLGTPASGSTGQNVNNVARAWLHGVYLQDDWKATRKLTLNLGLRWEVQRAMTDRYNRLFTFDYNAVNPACTAVGLNCAGAVKFATSGDRGQYDTNLKHFAPRIGFAYQLTPKLVMRGGYGIFYPNQYLNSPQITGYNSLTPYVASLDGGITPCTGCSLSNAFSSGPVPITGNSLGTLTNIGFSTGAVNPNGRYVILATDGDFNVGVSSDAELVRMIEEKRETGIYLTVLGYGMGNLKDSKLEQLAHHGNGHYAYIDTIEEARKVFVDQGGALAIVAKDVKLQVEFNHKQVNAYRLVGYENRVLRNEDFRDDAKDAGDMGSGHTCTALMLWSMTACSSNT
jgi:hypothetical protein